MAEGTQRLRNGIFAIADQAVVSAGTFLSTMLICRNCTDSDFGVFSLAWTIIAFLRTIQERMIAAPFLAFTFRPGFGRTSFRGSSLAHQAIFSGISTIVVATGAFTVWSLNFGLDQLSFGLSLAVALWFTLGRDQMRAISFTDFAILRLLIIDLIVVASQLIGLLMLVRMNRFSLVDANLILGFGSLIPLAFWFWLTRSKYSFDSKWIVKDWANNFAYSRWLVGARVLGIAPIVVIPWLIAIMEGEKGTGVFGVCSSLVGVSLMFVQGVNNLFQPRTVLELQKNGTRGLVAAIRESIAVICVGLIGISTLFFFYGGKLLAIFGSQYVSFGFLTFLLSLSTLVVSLSTMFANGLAALGKSKDFFWGEVSYCVVSIVLALILVPTLGLHGAALAMIAGGLATSGVTGITLARGIRSYSPNGVQKHSNEIAASEKLEIS